MVNILLSGRKVISVQDVNLKSGVSFLVRKLPEHRPKKLVKSGKTDLIKGFKKKSGGTYDTVLILEDKKTGKLGFPARAKK